MNLSSIQKKHTALFGEGDTITVRSPGRINLIGEHTGYNDGFVFPAAIDKAIWFTASKNNKEVFRFYAFDYSEGFEMKVEELSKSHVAWANYLLGVAHQFKKEISSYYQKETGISPAVYEVKITDGTRVMENL